ncbi:MAG: aspartate-semialdehyde dehydrogenase, partial [Lachnospiraceae bacterium]|nr:aspartate-semialdehyde dehydrogenase [Lachnospiraceae bacterium]
MKKVNVGILGATGAVGREMLKVLEERDFPIGTLRLFASSRSAGKVIRYRGQDIVIEEAKEGIYEGLDIVLGASANPVAKQMAPSIVAAGAVFVDNSSAFRMDPSVPLVVPEINPEDAKQHHG